MLNYGENLCRSLSSMSSCSSSSSSSSSVCSEAPRVRVKKSLTEQRFPCSQQSVLTAVERFVRAVNNMNDAILVPSRLHDIEVQNRRKTSLPPAGMHQQQHQDLYGFYVMLREVKNELLWGPSTTPSLFHAGSSSPVSGMSSPRRMPVMTTPPHLRQLSYRQASDDGLGSSTGCSSDQDTDSDFESIVTDRDSTMLEQTSHLANAFRHHLHGLHAILHQMADTADFVSARYQEEVDSPMM